MAQGEVGLGAHVVVAELGDLLEAQAQGGQRRAQLMRGVRRELPLGGDHRADAFGAGVQRHGDIVHLVDTRARRAGGEVALAEPARRDGKVVERPSQAPRQEDAEDRGERDGRRGEAADEEHDVQLPAVAVLVGQPHLDDRSVGKLDHRVHVVVGAGRPERRRRAVRVGDLDVPAVADEVGDGARRHRLAGREVRLGGEAHRVGLAIGDAHRLGAHERPADQAQRHAEEHDGEQRDRDEPADQSGAHQPCSKRNPTPRTVVM